jgi:putative (di)nucleoside polyphosphate hydrolase
MKPYRKNVGIVVFNSKGQVLMGNRLSHRSSWQFPQGGIDDKEEPKDAAKRELYEEVGIENGEFIFESPDWLKYDFPADIEPAHLQKYQGQMQKWYLVYWDEPASKCKLDLHEREFESVKFYPLKNCANTIVEFKKDVYKQLIILFGPEIEKFLAANKEKK